MSDFDDDPDLEDDSDDEKSDEDESEYPNESDVDQDDGDEYSETPPCPYCGKSLFEQSEICPHCGKYISREDANWRRPVWIVIGVIACLIMILIWIL